MIKAKINKGINQLIKKIFFYLLIIQPLTSFYSVFATSSIKEVTAIQERMENLSTFLNVKELTSVSVNKDSLPTPYSFLLIQPLMTLGIEQYYQRTPEIRTIHAQQDRKNNRYSRAIYMVLNKEKKNSSKLKQSNEITVELAFITINFNELPNNIVKNILQSKTPFGKLLANNKIDTFAKDRAYFSVQCTNDLMKILHCKTNTPVYGRINTLVRKDTKNWVAQVIEILSGVTCNDPQCTVLLMP